MIYQTITYGCDADGCKSSERDETALVLGATLLRAHPPNGWLTVTLSGADRIYCPVHKQRLLEAIETGAKAVPR